MPDNDDKEIWAAYAKGVKPLRGLNKSRQAAKRRSKGAAPSSKADKAGDRRRLRESTEAIEARLDLHGMYQAEAHKALIAFVAAQAKAGHRRLLVITGKGSGQTGVLRTRLADWLAASPLAAHILALHPAAPRHGGAGAFYVMLRKRKD